MKESKIARTPREYCRNRQALPFGQARQRSGCPDWRKAGAGLLAVTDGTERQMVPPGLLYGVEIGMDGAPVIVRYWAAEKAVAGGAVYDRPYTLKSLKWLIACGKVERREELTFEAMKDQIRQALPGAWLPALEQFAGEYGVGIHGGKLINVRGFAPDED